MNILFSNEVSRLIRGIAILLMVANHTFPGKIIGFAVPLFSFLVGYGYRFAKRHDLRHSLQRSWHLLSHFWFLLFIVCIPSALIVGNTDVKWQEVLLNMFGLSGKYNFYCWYIYFYLVAMALMPALSRVIDRYEWKGFIGLAAICGIGAGTLYLTLGPKFGPGWAHVGEIAYRCLRYMPIVLAGYALSPKDKITTLAIQPPLKKRRIRGAVALCALPAIYFLRGLPYVQILDFVWASAACAAVAAIFAAWRLKWIRKGLEALGIESMGIWFLHALFFTHTTRALYLPLINWAPAGICRYLLIVVLSFAFAWITSKAFAWTRNLLSRAVSRLLKINATNLNKNS